MLHLTVQECIGILFYVLEVIRGAPIRIINTHAHPEVELFIIIIAIAVSINTHASIIAT